MTNEPDLRGTPAAKSWMYRAPENKWIRWGQWILIPAILLFALEHRMKPWTIKRETGYIEAAAKPPAKPVDAIFIGVSRVEAAIDPDAFDSRYKELTGKEYHSLNLGHPSRTAAVHYFGLRKLFTKYPNLFKNCTVFIEAPFDLPEARTWQDNWADPGYEKLLVPLLTKSDFGRFLNEAKLSSDERMLYRELWYEQKSYLIYYRKIIRKQAMTKYDGVFAKLVGKVHHIAKNTSGRTLDIKSDGSIRIDENAAEVGLDKAKSWLHGTVAPVPVADWNKTVLADIRKLVEQNGGKLVLFTMPMSSVFAPGYETPVKDTDRRTLIATRATWAVPLITATDFEYNDSDFPDTWHLSGKRSHDFSSRLADAYYKTTMAGK